MKNLKKAIEKTLNEQGYLTTSQYAKKRKVSEWWVRQLCNLKKVKSKKLYLGYIWIIDDQH